MHKHVTMQRNGRFYQLPIMFGPVGLGTSTNDIRDVRMIQAMLNRVVANGHFTAPTVNESGWINAPTVLLIQKFQETCCAPFNRDPKGYVVPDSQTLAKLVELANTKAQKPKPVAGSGPWTTQGPSPRQLSGSEIPPNGNPSICWELPPQGLGFVTYNRNDTNVFYPDRKRMPDQIGTKQTIDNILALGREWFRKNPTRPLQIGDISLPGGIDTPDHKTHMQGRDVDVRPIRKDGQYGNTAKLTYNSPEYDQELTRELLRLVVKLFPGTTFFFNDKEIYHSREFQNVVKPSDSSHDNHIHIMLK